MGYRVKIVTARAERPELATLQFYLVGKARITQIGSNQRKGYGHD